jgi:beta-glucosidase
MKRTVFSLIDGLTNAGFSIDTELEGMYKPMQQIKKQRIERREREGGLMATHSVSLNWS